MKLKVQNLKIAYKGENTISFAFKVGLTEYRYYYHKELNSTHCNCSAYENEHNDNLIKELAKQHH